MRPLNLTAPGLTAPGLTAPGLTALGTAAAIGLAVLPWPAVAAWVGVGAVVTLCGRTWSWLTAEPLPGGTPRFGAVAVLAGLAIGGTTAALGPATVPVLATAGAAVVVAVARHWTPA